VLGLSYHNECHNQVVMLCTITEGAMEDFFVVKVKKRVKQSVPATFKSLSPTLQSTVFNVVSQYHQLLALGCSYTVASAV